MLNQLRSALTRTSGLAKVVLGIIVVVILLAVVDSIISRFQISAYREREAAREVERAEWVKERQTLLNQVAASEALTEAAKHVAAVTRGEAFKTIQELEKIEEEHEKNKQQVEAGDTAPVDELRAELARTLCARGYKSACPK